MQNVNQFGMSVEKGMTDLKLQGAAESCIAAAQLTAGMLVKLVDGTSGIPTVTPITAVTDDIYGVVALELRRGPTVPSGERCEIVTMHGAVIYMEASAAIARGAKVTPVIAGEKVVTAVSTNRIVGRAIDRAAGAGSLIRVKLELPGSVAP